MSKTGALRKQLGPLKYHLTNKIKSAQEALHGDSEHTADHDEYLDDLKEMKAALHSSTNRVQTKHDEWVTLLQDLNDAEELEREQAHYDEVCEEFMNLLIEAEETQIKLDRRINKVAGQHDNIAASRPSTPGRSIPHSNENLDQRNLHDGDLGNDDTCDLGNRRSHTAIKVPKMTLPRFGGNYMEWKQFWGIFEANIDKKPEFTNIERFTYLLGQLDGIAKDTVSGLLITDDNYKPAIALLKERFDRADERMISMLYSQLKQIPSSGGASKDRQKTLDDCEKIFRQLETAGEDINSNRSLTIDLLSKFPAAMVRDLQRYYHVSSTSKLSEVRQGLKKSIMEWETTAGIIDDLQTMKNKNDRNDRQPNFNRDRKQDGRNPNDPPRFPEDRFFQNSALAAMGRRPMNSHSQMAAPPGRCYFCDGEHFNNLCDKYPSAASRIQRLEQLHRCSRCLRRDHSTSQCNRFIRCFHCREDNQHTTPLCPRHFPEKRGAAGPNNWTDQGQGTRTGRGHGNTHKPPENLSPSNGFTMLNNESRPTLFQTARATIENPKNGQRVPLRLAFDTMSSRSYITDAAARQIGLFGPDDEKMYVSIFGSRKTYEFPSRLVKFNIYFRDGEKQEMAANTTNVICNSTVFPGTWSNVEERVLKQFKYSLADDPFDVHGKIDILVGADLVWDFIDGGKVCTDVPDLYLIPSKFGLMLAGKSAFFSNPKPGSTLLCITESSCNFPSETGLVTITEGKSDQRYPDIDEFWDLERIGISDDPVENDDDKALEEFQKTVKFEDDRYQVTFPWIDEKKPFLSDNYDLAYERFRGLAKRLHSNPDALQAYRETIALQKDRRIIEAVPQSQIYGTPNTVHYLPHHFVVKPGSNTTKFRIVYDAAARKCKDALSLNQCLMRGPVILPDLCQMLMRIRLYPIIVISDIEKAFLQVGLQECDRDVTRFLWFKDDSNPSLKENIQVLRFRRVAFGIICSPFLLAATIDHHLSQEQTAFATSLRKDIYVDNVISTLETEENVVAYYRELKTVFSRAGMNIQGFCSNSRRLMEAVAPEDLIRQTDAKLLGLKWDSQGDDTLRIVPSAKLQTRPPGVTKRHILQALGSIFDPLGYFQPVVLNAKFILRTLWTKGAGWDEPAPETIQADWKTVYEDLLKLFDVRIPRFIGSPIGETSFVVFCDASGKAYACCVYIRSKMRNGEWTANLLFSKSRLAPCVRDKDAKRRDITLPRQELLGVFIGTKAGEFCRKLLPDAHIDFFTDSECVMYWIQSRYMLKRFVDRRVSKMRSVKNCEFHYVPTGENPADLSTRGVTAEQLSGSNLWWHGPRWLAHGKEAWPDRNVPSVTDEKLRQIQSEVKPAFLSQTMATVDKDPDPPLGIDCSRFSSLAKLIRVTAYCLKFIRTRIWVRLKDETQNRHKDLVSAFDQVSTDTFVTAEEFHFAKLLWVKLVQLSEFDNILQVLSRKQSKRIPIVAQLGLVLDSNGFIRSQGRFELSDLCEKTKRPILLPRNHHFTKLVIMDVHGKIMHSGVSHTLSEVRSEFWIPHGRIVVKRVINSCLLCRRYKTSTPFKLPPMPPWPRERMTRSIPFQYCGLDYFGPIYVKVRDVKVKMWVCLFTCMVVRAVHLEAVSDCSSEAFLSALIRFICRRGVPDAIVSDNAAQFRLVKILGDKAWSRTPTDPQLATYLAQNRIRWKFITELAPWQGGFYERLVGVVKSTLRTSIGRRLLSWTDLVTMLCEAEAVVNSRPITHVGDDPSSRFRVLRPIDFLSPTIESFSDLLQTTEISNSTFGDAGKRLLAVWKNRCKAIDKLWRFWHEEYLLSLRERQVGLHRSRKGELPGVPSVGQVVLVLDPDLPRGQWKLARVVQVFKSQDGQVRSAEVLLSNGFKIKRPINQLVPVEIPVEEDDACPNPTQKTATPSHEDESQSGEPDGELFFGFSANDVKRAEEALRRFDANDQH